jgi:hypothetical protein
MADGWRCPECHLILAPDVREHRCEPPEAGVSVRPVVAPYSPSGGATTWTPPNITVTPGGTYTGTIWTSGSGGGGGSPNAQEWLCCSSWPAGVSWGERAA